MSLDSIKSHMNEHHADNLKDLVIKYGAFEPKSATLENVTKDGLFIKADGKEVFAPFPQVTEEKDYKDAIIALCKSVKSGDDNAKNEKVAHEIKEFKNSFDSVLIASLTKDKSPHLSYSPLLKHEDKFYLYVSEVAAHTQNLRDNPESVQVMFIEDESKSKTIIARKRLTYDVSVEFLPRDSNFEHVFNDFEKHVESIGKGGGVSTIRQMTDFHLVRLHFKQGRFVKGFGAAYNVDSHGKVSHVGGGKGGIPHNMPHGHGGGHGHGGHGH